MKGVFAVWLAAAWLSTSLAAQEGREEIVRRGYEHTRKITTPIRKLSAEQITIQHLMASGSDVLVIGSISDWSLRAIFVQFEERGQRVTKVTGDEKFAFLEIGDPEQDSCCFTTILFANQDGRWFILRGSWRSH